MQIWGEKRGEIPLIVTVLQQYFSLEIADSEDFYLSKYNFIFPLGLAVSAQNLSLLSQNP